MTHEAIAPWTTDEHLHDAPDQDIDILTGSGNVVCTVPIDDAPVHDYNTMQRGFAWRIVASVNKLSGLTVKEIERFEVAALTVQRNRLAELLEWALSETCMEPHDWASDECADAHYEALKLIAEVKNES